jgi:hypothetical protein
MKENERLGREIFPNIRRWGFGLASGDGARRPPILAHEGGICVRLFPKRWNVGKTGVNAFFSTKGGNDGEENPEKKVNLWRKWII